MRRISIIFLALVLYGCQTFADWREARVEHAWFCDNNDYPNIYLCRD